MPKLELTIEQNFKLRRMKDLLEKCPKEEMIPLFLSLQETNFILTNNIGELLKQWNTPLTTLVAQFILGNETNNEVISAFIEKYGPTSFRELRRAVLKTLAPNAQTEGMIKGSLAGGMKDDIFGVIGDPEKNGQRVAVSQDEFIVPADVVSMLGDGSSDAGANKLYNMMKRIREEKTATTKQARPINDNKVMPA